MGAMASENLLDAIRDATFPDSEELLSSQITSDSISSLLDAISQTKQELNDDIKATSREQAVDVDDWIAQAKKVQEDIVRCKLEAQQIVQEHERVEALRDAAKEAEGKEQFLQHEIEFTQTLIARIQHVAKTTKALDEVDKAVSRGAYLEAAKGLAGSRSLIEDVVPTRTRTLISSLNDDLDQRLRSLLSQTLAERLDIEKDGTSIIVEIKSGANSELSNQSQQETNSLQIGTANAFEAFSVLGELQEGVSLFVQKLEFHLLPHLSRQSPLRTTSAVLSDTSLQVALQSNEPSADQIINVVETILQYLWQNLPQSGQHQVISRLFERIIPLVISDWLDAAIPTDLQSLDTLSALQDRVNDFATKLEEKSLPGVDDLHQWNNHIPRTWLAKRRMNSLDAVRHAFSLAQGVLREVQRVERQMITIEPAEEVENQEADDWNAGWDDEESDHHDTNPNKSSEENDDTDAWGFEDNEGDTDKQPTNGSSEHKEDEDEGEAWGWGDEDESPAEEKKTPPKVKATSTSANGATMKKSQPQPQQQELVLAENYSITDIPDHILELVGKDVQDAEDLQASTTAPQFLKATATSLATLPTLTLAMFRAVSPTLYSQLTSPTTSLPLSNMNLYNDCLYLSGRLSSSTFPAQLASESTALTKFARHHFSQSMDVQRTILSDLLDNAQGFVSCTRPPYADECTTAISSTIDHLRSTHREWSAILSPSHLQQAVGALLNTVIGKLIKDIEDMEDISEPESRRLHQFCEDVSALQDLFTSSPVPKATEAVGGGSNPGEDEAEETVSSVAVYVPSWLRFQYLMQILDSSLVDIKYLWTDAGLALEFDKDEVIDLMKALFSDSTHRRNAIAAVRAG